MVNQEIWEEPAMKAKSFDSSKRAVFEAWKKVRANKGAAGVDGVSVSGFEQGLENNLYNLWNRMASGAYFAPPVRRVMIPKADGGERPLGIPTVGDRVAQMVAKAHLEPLVEPMYHSDSYAYRPRKSASDAVGKARKRCWRYDWVVDLDIKGFFDNIDHALMMHAVRKHTDCKWLLLYIERWLKAPVVDEHGAKPHETR
jgi:RNA-directed DNA polymerase